MRIIGEHFESKDKVLEAFKAGSAAIVYQKIVKILSRRIHVQLRYAETPVPVFFKHPQLGKLAGFYFMHPTGTKMYRLNFSLMDGRDKIVSVDVFNEMNTLIPTYTIDLQGQNVIQVLDCIGDVLTGVYFDYAFDIEGAEAVNESVQHLGEATHSDIVKDWITATPTILRALQGGNYEIDDLFTQYAAYSRDERGKKPCAAGSFRWNLQHALHKMGSRIVIPTVRVSSGVRTVALQQQSQETAFEDQVINNDHVLTFEFMKHTIERMKVGDKYVKNVYIYGVGGIGKSKNAIDILGGMPNFVLQKSPIRGYTGLLQFLFENKDGKIIVMDDCIKPEDMKNGMIENILKAVMDSDEPRIVRIPRAQTRAAQSAGQKITRNRVNEIEEIDLVDFEDPSGYEEENPFNFKFTSRIVFITNIPYIPEAIGDRCVTIEMNFNKDQILDIIKNALEGFDPEVPIEDKLFVWNWLTEHKNIAKKISFRVFSNILGIYLVGKETASNKWESFAKLMLKSGMAPNY